MNPFQHLLIATDFGAESRAALELAISIIFYWPVEELERVSRRMLDATFADAAGRCPRLDAKLAFGDPAQHILGSANEQKAAAIIVGTHGRRGIPRALLGNVAAEIVRLSPLPVFVVPCPSKSSD